MLNLSRQTLKSKCVIPSLFSRGYLLVFFPLSLSASAVSAFQFSLKPEVSASSLREIKQENMLLYEKDNSLVKTIAARLGDQLDYKNIPTGNDLLEVGLGIQLKEISELGFVKKVMLDNSQVSGKHINRLIADNEKSLLAVYFPPVFLYCLSL